MHFNLLMLPLKSDSEDNVEKCIKIMKDVIEPQIRKLISENCPSGHVNLHFEQLEFNGSHEKTKWIFMKAHQEGPEFEVL